MSLECTCKSFSPPVRPTFLRALVERGGDGKTEDVTVFFLGFFVTGFSRVFLVFFRGGIEEHCPGTYRLSDRHADQERCRAKSRNGPNLLEFFVCLFEVHVMHFRSRKMSISSRDIGH